VQLALAVLRFERTALLYPAGGVDDTSVNVFGSETLKLTAFRTALVPAPCPLKPLVATVNVMV
jgi:hypothetical protein